MTEVASDWKIFGGSAVHAAIVGRFSLATAVPVRGQALIPQCGLRASWFTGPDQPSLRTRQFFSICPVENSKGSSLLPDGRRCPLLGSWIYLRLREGDLSISGTRRLGVTQAQGDYRRQSERGFGSGDSPQR